MKSIYDGDEILRNRSGSVKKFKSEEAARKFLLRSGVRASEIGVRIRIETYKK